MLANFGAKARALRANPRFASTKGSICGKSARAAATASCAALCESLSTINTFRFDTPSIALPRACAPVETAGVKILAERSLQRRDRLVQVGFQCGVHGRGRCVATAGASRERTVIALRLVASLPTVRARFRCRVRRGGVSSSPSPHPHALLHLFCPPRFVPRARRDALARLRAGCEFSRYHPRRCRADPR